MKKNYLFKGLLSIVFALVAGCVWADDLVETSFKISFLTSDNPIEFNIGHPIDEYHIPANTFVSEGVTRVEPYPFKSQSAAGLSWTGGGEIVIKPYDSSSKNGFVTFTLSNRGYVYGTKIVVSAYAESSNGTLTVNDVSNTISAGTTYSDYTFEFDGSPILNSIELVTANLSTIHIASITVYFMGIPLTIQEWSVPSDGAAGYTTYYNSEVPYILADGLTGQTVTAAAAPAAGETGEITTVDTYTEEYDEEGGCYKDIVPADEPLLITGTPGTYYLAPTVTTVTASTSNLLYGGTEVPTDADYYFKLSLNSSNETGSIGFYWGAADGSSFTFGANKCYLALSAAEASSVKSFKLSDNSTGLNTVKESLGTKTVYDLSGRQVKNPSKGMYIVNGKKVMY